MAYKLIAIDMDDTLLTDDLVIPAHVKQAIRMAAAQGVRVVLCTGRTIKSTKRYYDELGLDTLCITAGGAEVYDADGHAVFTRDVDPPLVKQVLEFAYEKDLHAQVYINGELVYRDKNRFAEEYEIPYGFPGILEPDLLSRPEIITPKVLLIMDADKLPAVKEEAEKRFKTLTIKRSKPIYLEFAHPSVDKGEALAFVANYYGIDSRDVIAVGDADIDIPMLKYAGLGVAMANASPAVQQAADVVCSSNQQGGIADVIKEYILEASYEDHAQDR